MDLTDVDLFFPVEEDIPAPEPPSEVTSSAPLSDADYYQAHKDDPEEWGEPEPEPETVYEIGDRAVVFVGDCVDVMRAMAPDSVDAIVTDPPYGLGFMGKKWDTYKDFEGWTQRWAEAAYRILKPGGHLLSFCGTRMYHQMATGIEKAGFEIRDCIQWIYGQGFPKSMDVSKAIDKMMGVDRTVVSRRETGQEGGWNTEQGNSGYKGSWDVTVATSEEAKQWDGWGTALKPANEPIAFARKPLGEGTIAANVLKYGTGAINIDATRIEYDESEGIDFSVAREQKPTDGVVPGAFGVERLVGTGIKIKQHKEEGRWPSNIILGHHDECDEIGCHEQCAVAYLGEQARFFYVAKASKSEREEGLRGRVPCTRCGQIDSTHHDLGKGKKKCVRNDHPTVKPVSLMAYLTKMVAPPNGVVLDPFLGSGSTGVGAVREGFRFVGIELDPHSADICRARIEGAME